MAHTHTLYSQAFLFFLFKSTDYAFYSVPHTCFGNLLLNEIKPYLRSLFFFCAAVSYFRMVLWTDICSEMHTHSHTV